MSAQKGVLYFAGDHLNDAQYVTGRAAVMSHAVQQAADTGKCVEIMVTTVRRRGTKFLREVSRHAMAIFTAITEDSAKWKRLKLEMEELNQPQGSGINRVVAKLVIAPRHSEPHRRADDSTFDDPLPHAS